MADDNTIVFRSATVPLFADSGTRYVSAAPKDEMTMADVCDLAAKGDKLSYADLEPYHADPVVEPHYREFQVDGGAYLLGTFGAPSDDDIYQVKLARRQADGSYATVFPDIRDYDINKYFKDDRSVLGYRV